MLGQDIPEPKFWKALVAALLIAVPTILLSHGLFPSSPLWPWFAGGITLALCGAYSVHRKAKYDASAQWEMNFSEVDRSTYIPPDVTIKRK